MSFRSAHFAAALQGFADVYSARGENAAAEALLKRALDIRVSADRAAAISLSTPRK